MRLHIAVLVLALSALTASATELNFRSITWKEALDAAGKEHKLVFVDGYTEWCGWCKVLDKNTFSNDTVAEYMNKHFVCIKLDMERDFGRLLSMKYRANAYPSQLIFNAKGRRVYSAVGYQPPADFLAMLKKAVDPAMQTDYPAISDEVELPFPKFYADAFGPNGHRTFPDSATVIAYLDAQKDLTTEVNWNVLARFASKSAKYGALLYDRAPEFAAKYGWPAVTEPLQMMLVTRARMAADKNDTATLADVLAKAEHIGAEKPRELQRSMRMTFNQQTGRWEAFADDAEAMLREDNFAHASSINSISWAIYEKCEDQTVLKRAVGWMEKAVALEPSYENLDTQAALFYKTGSLEKAEQTALRAIEEGKKSKADVSSTEKLLNAIKGKTAAK